jgi:hypothetical protein
VKKLLGWITGVIGACGIIYQVRGGDLHVGYLITAIVMVIVGVSMIFVKRNVFCAWCGNHKLEFISGSAGEFFWKYRNKDGSRDKRVKDNFQQANYFSEWKCKKCGAKTKANHFVDQNPSKKVKACNVYLKSGGSGKRKKTDWVAKGAVTIDSSSEHRKGG